MKQRCAAGCGRQVIVALAALALSLLVSARARAGDPFVHWYTIETPHFRIHYHAGLERLAQRSANIAEDVYERLLPALGRRSVDVTEVVLTDESSYANGVASTLPYNHVLLFVTAPDDMSGLGDHDDWVTALFTHEFTHILHTGNVSGLPAVVNSIFGPTLHPNQQQPRWITEGLAVLMETEHTTGGRLRSSQFEMLIRADVLAGRIARLDEISHPVRRYPGGALWYLYGAYFMAWIGEIYGSDVFAAVADDYGDSLIPWGINRMIRRKTGRTYEELYEGFVADLTRRVRDQVKAVERAGLREGRRLTFHGQSAFAPRFLPVRCSREPKLAYFRFGSDDQGGVYFLPADGKPDDGRAELVARASGRSVAFGPDCALYYDHVAPSRRHYFFPDLFRQASGTSSPGGYEKNRERLTIGRRAREADVSADGRFIAYVTDRHGTSTLRIAELSPSGRLSGERRATPSAPYEQVFTPRFSPDGRYLAYGVWTRGGFRDLRLFDLHTGKLVELWHDRAIEQQPVFSPDGKTLYFTSDRSGIPNVFAYQLETGALFQVTNVLTGAYMPEPSPDGRRLVYVGYTSEGFDLFEMPLDRARFLPAKPPKSERPLPRGEPFLRNYPVEPFNPLPTLRPRNWEVSYGDGVFGDAVSISTGASDAIGRHSFFAELVLETDLVEPLGSLDYYYGRLPFGFRATVFRSAAPRDDYRVGEFQRTVTERQTGVTTGVFFGVPGDHDAQQISLSYTMALWDHDQPLDDFDPFAPLPFAPDRGFIAIARLGYDFSNASATPYAISLERGFGFGVAVDAADPAWGSESTLTAVSAVLTGYVPMPWLDHHVLALGLSGAAAVGDYARWGLYYTGGFGDTPAFDAFTSGIRQGAFVLRGYEPGQFSGSQYNLMNVEYRFPIAYVDRGVSTLPAFLRTLTGNLFFDWGGAYDQMDLENPLDVYQVGIGAELWIDLVLGYSAQADLRLGVAKGLDSQAPRGAGPLGLQTYFVASSGF